MKLYLMRHGDALPSDVDSERQLSELGKKQVTSIGKFCAEAGIVPEKIMHSPKVRAKESAGIIHQTIAPHLALVQLEGILPMDPVETVASMMGVWNADVMIIGHQPFLGNLAAYLLTGRTNGVSIHISTATMVCLERASSGFWRMEWMMPPALLLSE